MDGQKIHSINHQWNSPTGLWTYRRCCGRWTAGWVDGGMAEGSSLSVLCICDSIFHTTGNLSWSVWHAIDGKKLLFNNKIYNMVQYVHNSIQTAPTTQLWCSRFNCGSSSPHWQQMASMVKRQQGNTPNIVESRYSPQSASAIGT